MNEGKKVIARFIRDLVFENDEVRNMAMDFHAEAFGDSEHEIHHKAATDTIEECMTLAAHLED